MRRAATVCFVALLVGAAACSSSSAKSGTKQVMPWPLPDNPMALTRKAGLAPETAEQLKYHVHAYLTMSLNGDKVVIPGGIGIDTHGSSVQTGEAFGYPSYGGIGEPCDAPCISPLHTHDASGQLHTESATPTPNTLGQFFAEWNVKLDENCVGEDCKPKTPITITVDGEAFTGDPATIELSDQRKIDIKIG